MRGTTGTAGTGAALRCAPIGRLLDICFDCRDPWALAHWWAETIGYRVRPYTDDDLADLRRQGIERPEDDPAVAVDPVNGHGPTLWFTRVDEPKAAKNRVHLDVEADLDELLARGATVVDRQPRWTVVADPEGNELCVFAPSDDQ